MIKSKQCSGSKSSERADNFRGIEMGLRLVCLLLALDGVSATCDTHNGISPVKCRSCLAADASITGCACEYDPASGTCQSTTGLFGCESGSDGFMQDANSCPECVQNADCSDSRSASGPICVDNTCRECAENADCSDASFGLGATCDNNRCLRADPEHTDTGTGTGAGAGTSTGTGKNSRPTCDNDMWHVMKFLALAFALGNFVIWCAVDFWVRCIVVRTC